NYDRAKASMQDLADRTRQAEQQQPTGEDSREQVQAEMTAALFRQARKGIFPRLDVPPKRDIRILTRPTFVSAHWIDERRRHVLCPGKCEWCNTFPTKTLGYLLVLTREPRICWLNISEEEFVPLEDAMLVGLRI